MQSSEERKHSVGVARQYCGQLDKQDNCQVAVSLSLACPQGSLPIAYQLYLPKDWEADPVRCKKAGVPEDITSTVILSLSHGGFKKLRSTRSACLTPRFRSSRPKAERCDMCLTRFQACAPVSHKQSPPRFIDVPVAVGGDIYSYTVRLGITWLRTLVLHLHALKQRDKSLPTGGTAAQFFLAYPPVGD